MSYPLDLRPLAALVNENPAETWKASSCNQEWKDDRAQKMRIGRFANPLGVIYPLKQNLFAVAVVVHVASTLQRHFVLWEGSALRSLGCGLGLANCRLLDVVGLARLVTANGIHHMKC